MQFDRIHFYVEDAQKWRDWFVQTMGFEAIASASNSQTRTEVVSSGSPAVNLVLSSPLASSSPIAGFLRQHPPGVADLALKVTNLDAAVARAAQAGASIHPIQERHYPQGQLRWCQTGRDHLRHTLIERTGLTPILPDVWEVQQSSKPAQARVTAIDHVVLNVAAGELEKTANWYQTVLGFQPQQSFTIQTEQSALYSQVMVHPISRIQLPINEPRSANSQIQEFLDLNRGPGIQHIALTTTNITQATQSYRAAGLSFLKVPANYYRNIMGDSQTDTSCQRPPLEGLRQLGLTVREWQEIVAQEILLDLQEFPRHRHRNQSRPPLLLQIFTQPIFAQPTFFFELIERRFQAKGFGEGNFRALFEAIENEQLKRGSLAPAAAKPMFNTSQQQKEQ
ncbi:MAG: 4-hydroxyphenylpyruvate dioxygenase [Cyanophyceae cyanobacterium]